MRNLLRNKVLSFINITGLSIGLACCLLIFLYTKDELSYDRFHAKGDQLYRITCQIKEKEGDVRKFGIGGQTQAPSFKAAIPEIKEFVRVQERDFTIKRGNETFEDKASWVDNNFFSVFSFPLITGDPKSVLSGMNSIVLTDESAIKYFGTKDAVGKTLELEIGDKFEPFIVSGIARRSPENSSIKFKMLLPFSYLEEHDKDEGWMFLSYPSYLVMDAHVNQQAVAAKMKQVYQTKAKDQIIDEHKHGGDAVFTWGVQPLREVHLDTTVLYTDNGSDPIYSYILSGIAIFILLIACINFINLTVAQSLKRSKEIGIRKVIGGQRKQLMKQFLGESFLLCFIAFLFAIVLAELVLPVFNQLSNKRLSLDYLIDTKLVLCFIGLFLVTGFIAGFYPALVLSGFDPVKTLYNRSRFTGKNY
ncbi:MAG TPA: ABC transporter permease, partial [Chitinophagaceae bacterium]|nr:ABC transporter permease [Chitinophagaceae bacterium]